MRNPMARRPSPGLVVACLALIVALGGTAVALPGKNTVDAGDIKKNAVRAKHIKKNQVKPAALKPAARAPRAYALVTANNQVDESRSRGITDDMVSLENDVYCFNNLGFNPRHVQVTVDRTGVNGDVIAQATLTPGTACAGEEQAVVRMWDVSAGIDVSSPDFYIAFFH